ncbi:hypothetical protein RJZ90_004696 [Blastomyces dermatitidis]
MERSFLSNEYFEAGPPVDQRFTRGKRQSRKYDKWIGAGWGGKKIIILFLFIDFQSAERRKEGTSTWWLEGETEEKGEWRRQEDDENDGRGDGEMVITPADLGEVAADKQR